jgi:hypothetical protein
MSHFLILIETHTFVHASNGKIGSIENILKRQFVVGNINVVNQEQFSKANSEINIEKETLTWERFLFILIGTEDTALFK